MVTAIDPEELAKVKASLLNARLPAKAGVSAGVAHLTLPQVDILLDLIALAQDSLADDGTDGEGGAKGRG